MSIETLEVIIGLVLWCKWFFLSNCVDDMYCVMVGSIISITLSVVELEYCYYYSLLHSHAEKKVNQDVLIRINDNTYLIGYFLNLPNQSFSFALISPPLYKLFHHQFDACILISNFFVVFCLLLESIVVYKR